MAKFIKLTNSRPYSVAMEPLSVVEEVIISTDRICSISKDGDKYSIVTKVDIIDKRTMQVQHTTAHAIISKDDYENAKKILLEV